ncbi:hypothetical protein P8452_53542 [Trifolium repens]|nr:hypothetical protein P8452_53542 [Trifolium repens]
MLSTALNFKTAFAAYKEREPHYDFAPSLEEWNKVEKVCKLLEIFNRATHVISGSDAGGRVIDERRTKLSEGSVEALICGGDWFRHKYNVKKKSKVEKDETHITLKI